jgi:aerobic-type carbon monoxide dehydrogenase small subunit (CoxS/CutS family)
VANASVSVAAAGAPAQAGLASSVATTDADGRFSLDGLAPGKVTVTAAHPDFQAASRGAGDPSAPTEVVIGLGHGAEISGAQTAQADSGGLFRFDHLGRAYDLGASRLSGREATMTESIRFRLNGKPTTVQADGERLLLWVLRVDLGLTGAKYGCGIGECGACTVLVDRKAVSACQTPVKLVAGTEVVTIEGLASGGKLHPVQEAFLEHGAFQCGYCTPGMILGACALLASDPHPSREAIVKGMEGNLCRCGAHPRIVAAIEAASRGKAGAP